MKLSCTIPPQAGDERRAKKPNLDRASVVAPILGLLGDSAFFGKIQGCVSPELETLFAAVRGGGVRAKTFKKIVAEIAAISAGGDIEDSTAVIFLGVFKDQVQKVADRLKEMDCENELERLEAMQAAITEEYDEKIADLSKKFAVDKKKLVAERDAKVGELRQLFKESGYPVSLLLACLLACLLELSSYSGFCVLAEDRLARGQGQPAV